MFRIVPLTYIQQLSAQVTEFHIHLFFCNLLKEISDFMYFEALYNTVWVDHKLCKGSSIGYSRISELVNATNYKSRSVVGHLGTFTGTVI